MLRWPGNKSRIYAKNRIDQEGCMSENIKNDIQPITYTKSNALALLRIIKISEDEITRGKYEDSDVVFSNLESTYFRK